jgi:hypothetical protein
MANIGGVSKKQLAVESFLDREGLIISEKGLTWEKIPKGYAPVVLTRAGAFSDAQIIHSASQLASCLKSRNKNRTVFLVSTDKLPIPSK